MCGGFSALDVVAMMRQHLFEPHYKIRGIVFFLETLLA